MPFTFAHPAAVLPLFRVPGLVPAALVVGSMAPDAEYFVHLSARRTIGHTAFGLAVMCVPVGLALWLLWDRLWRPALATAWKAVSPASASPLTPVLVLRSALSVALGAATHLLWDAATHGHGSLVERWPALRDPALTLAGSPLEWYRVLQHGSTFLGFAIIAAHLFPRAGRASPRRASSAPPVRLLLVLAAFHVLAGSVALATADAPWSARGLVHAALSACSAFALAFTLWAASLRWLPGCRGG